MSNTTQKKKWSVAILQSSMKKKVQKSFSSIILNILVNNSNKSSLEQIAKTVNERINKVTFGEWNVIVGRNFCNSIRYNVRYFYYSRALKGGVQDLEFMIYRCGPKVPSVITENNNNNNNNTNTKVLTEKILKDTIALPENQGKSKEEIIEFYKSIGYNIPENLMTGSNQVTIPEGSVVPRPDGSAGRKWDREYGNTHNADGTPKT